MSREELPHDLNCLTIAELEHHASLRMDKQTRDYYNEGADSGSTLRENTTAYNKYRIRPRVMRDISHIDTSVSLFGQKVSMPIGVAPTAMQCLAHPDGEVATAKACSKSGVPIGLSSFATKTLEEVAAATREEAEKRTGEDIPKVLQLYLFEEREHSRKLIQRAKKAGYKAVFLTVDTPVLGRRNLEIRNQFKLPQPYKIANFADEEDSTRVTAAAQTVMNGAPPPPSKPTISKENSSTSTPPPRHPPTGPITFHTHAPNPTLTWRTTLPWLQHECCPEMQIWLKGIATAEDALLALQHRVSGIIVSNHGGRQLDGALATIDALPEIIAAVGGKLPVHVDGGIRRGRDVFTALALGADFVWVGRPVLWGLAYRGEDGVGLCLQLLGEELRRCMGLAGTVAVGEIGGEYLVRVGEGGFVSRL